MKRVLYSTLLCLTISSAAVAQNITLGSGWSKGSSNQKVLFVIDTVTAFGNKEFIFNTSKIESISLMKSDSAMLLYGDKGKYGAVLIKPKGPISFIRLEDILNNFNINTQDRKLKVGINGVIVNEPNNILADKDEVLKVAVMSRKLAAKKGKTTGKIRFINIITREGLKNGLH